MKDKKVISLEYKKTKEIPNPELKTVAPKIKSIPATSLQWNRTSPF